LEYETYVENVAWALKVSALTEKLWKLELESHTVDEGWNNVHKENHP
jgi:hypothetical protein